MAHGHSIPPDFFVGRDLSTWPFQIVNSSSSQIYTVIPIPLFHHKNDTYRQFHKISQSVGPSNRLVPLLKSRQLFHEFRGSVHGMFALTLFGVASLASIDHDERTAKIQGPNPLGAMKCTIIYIYIWYIYIYDIQYIYIYVYVCICICICMTNGGFLSHGGTPSYPKFAGWFVVENPTDNGWWLGLPPWRNGNLQMVLEQIYLYIDPPQITTKITQTWRCSYHGAHGQVCRLSESRIWILEVFGGSTQSANRSIGHKL